LLLVEEGGKELSPASLRSIIERLEKIIVSLTPRTRGSIGE
jgi:hypothetical protein